jgi:predicted patatin/cPLA2 family phospholipase
MKETLAPKSTDMETDTPERTLVIYFSAGAMSGVFSAGLTKAFEEAGIKPYVDSVYGNSAGALTAICFLSGQVDMGAKLYWEDLDGDKYIRWSRLLPYVLRGFSNAIFKTNFRLDPVFDIDYIQGILLSTRRINFEAIQNSGIKLFMVVYNLMTHTHESLQAVNKEDVIPMLRATAGGHPAYPHSEFIHGNLYVDGGTIDDKERIVSIIKRHPDKEIICVLNNPRWKYGYIKNLISRLGVAFVMIPFFGLREAYKTSISNFATVDIIELQTDYPFLHFIANDLIGMQMSTDPEHHKMLYKRGYELGKEFLLAKKLRTVPVEGINDLDSLK